MSRVDLILSRLDGVKRTGPGKWLAKCPHHDDHHPSFSIKLTDDNRILLHCFAGCDTESVLASVGLSFNDLFPDQHGRDYDPTKPKPKPPTFTARELLRIAVDEANFIGLCAEFMRRGHSLCESDAKRFELSKRVLEFVRREVLDGSY